MTEGEPRELIVYLDRAAHAFVLPTEGRLTLGRASENDIQVDDASVSRHHLCLHLGAEIQVEDLGSANGTYLVLAPEARADDDDTSHRNKNVLGSRLSAQILVALKPRDSLRIGSIFAEIRPHVRGGPTPVGARAAAVDGLDQAATAPAELGSKEQERQRVLAALASCGGNQTRAAKLLGFSRRTLVNRLREYSLPRPKKF